jgi:hypothetical protein
MTGAQLRSTVVAIEAEMGSGVEIPPLPWNGQQTRSILLAFGQALAASGGVIAGEGPPLDDVGRNGDVYFRMEAGSVALYGPKAGGEWGPASSFTVDLDAPILAHEARENPHPQYLTESDLNLDQVDNTSDADNPISDATQAALDEKFDASNVNAAALGFLAAENAQQQRDAIGVGYPTDQFVLTPSVADGAFVDVQFDPIGSVTMLLQASASHASWVRFYRSPAHRAADTRTAPSETLGELVSLGDARPYAEFVFGSGGLLDVVQTNPIPALVIDPDEAFLAVRVRNDSGSAAAIEVRCSCLPLAWP